MLHSHNQLEKMISIGRKTIRRKLGLDGPITNRGRRIRTAAEAVKAGLAGNPHKAATGGRGCHG